jgi:hypothetical protein
MSEHATITVTETDAQSLAEKLATFSESLAPAEQEWLARTVVRAAATSDEVQGYTNLLVFDLRSLLVQVASNTSTYNQAETLASSVRKKW